MPYPFGGVGCFGGDHAGLAGRFGAMADSEDTDEYLIYIGCGEVMRRLQVLELGLLGLGVPQDQAGNQPRAGH
jgi:hypothetical protein